MEQGAAKLQGMLTVTLRLLGWEETGGVPGTVGEPTREPRAL